MVVSWQGKHAAYPLGKNERSTDLTLEAGRGLLEVNFQTPAGRKIQQPWNDKTEQGDVGVERLTK